MSDKATVRSDTNTLGSDKNKPQFRLGFPFYVTQMSQTMSAIDQYFKAWLIHVLLCSFVQMIQKLSWMQPYLQNLIVMQ